eukprot:m.58249 g.58249  ORF g.58249 m.58249 type:complete len:266 (+) comp11668_c0_seq1:221-1018(+)
MGGKSSKAKKEDKSTTVAAQVQDTKKAEKASKPDKALKSANPIEEAAAAAAQQEETKEKEVQSQQKLGRKATKSIAARLTVGSVDLDEDAKKSTKGTKLFAAPSQPEHSRIFNALNPQKLYYESRREKAEAEEDKIVIGQRDFTSVLRDDDGNIIDQEESSESGEESDYDPENLPDFGEFQGEMDKMRQERAKKQDERRAKLRAEYEAKKKAEEEERQKELALIKAKEDKIQAALNAEQDDSFVEQAQSRVEEEATQHLRRFSFK